MNKRIKELRNALGITQQEFADRLKTSRANIAGYEAGTRAPSNAASNNICREFNVSEEWLKNGTGEMFISSDSDFSRQIDRIMQGESEAHKNIIKALLDASPEEIAAFDKFIDRYVALREDQGISIASQWDDIPDSPEELEKLYPPIEIDIDSDNKNAR